MYVRMYMRITYAAVALGRSTPKETWKTRTSNLPTGGSSMCQSQSAGTHGI